MKYAYIQNNIAAQVLRVHPETIYAPEMAAQFVECGDDVEVGWLWDGEQFTAPPAPPQQVPGAVTMRQARLALLGAGMLAQIDTAINALPSPQKEAAKIEWEYSQEVQRHNGFVSVLAPALGLTSAQLDALFLQASQL